MNAGQRHRGHRLGSLPGGRQRARYRIGPGGAVRSLTRRSTTRRSTVAARPGPRRSGGQEDRCELSGPRRLRACLPFDAFQIDGGRQVAIGDGDAVRARRWRPGSTANRGSSASRGTSSGWTAGASSSRGPASARRRRRRPHERVLTTVSSRRRPPPRADDTDRERTSVRSRSARRASARLGPRLGTSPETRSPAAAYFAAPPPEMGSTVRPKDSLITSAADR